MDRVSSFRGHVRSPPVSPIPAPVEAPSTSPDECPLEGRLAEPRIITLTNLAGPRMSAVTVLSRVLMP